MKRLITLAALAFAATPTVISAQPLPPSPQPTPQESTLVVQGDGLVERSPDQAKLSVQIVTNDDSATTSTSKNNDVYNALKGKVGALGLGPDAIRTTSFNVEFIPYPPKGLPPEQRQPRYGYVTTRSLQLTVSPIENVGKVVDAANAAGATNVGGISFELKNRNAAYLAALQSAMANAKQVASTVAGSGDVKIVRIRTINVGYEYAPVQPAPMAKAFAARAADATPTEIEPNGPIEVRAHVTVTYEIR